MAHALRLKVVAEGVETDAQRQFLTANGCDQMQGYYFSRPVPADECTRFIRERPTLPIRTPDLAKPIIVRA
jgi:EAL domain-containing protein (putative c-di-GMP-specific phosphodiesterase class I)